MTDASPQPELTYLDNAATSYPKPPAVIAAVRACLDQSLTVARSTHVAAFQGDVVLRRCRAKLARFFGAAQPEEMVYTYSATDGLNIALNGFIKPGGHVIVSPLEHHSVMRPLHHLRERLGVSWTEMPAGADGVVDPDDVARIARQDTCLIAINWISNVTGAMQPVADIGAVARELGVSYLVDAAQATGTHPVDVAAIGCDAMAQPAHKALFSLPGLGVLYVRHGADMAPWRIGGTGYRSDLVMQPEERPMRYESGTPNVPAIAGLDAAMDWFDATGVERIEAHCAGLIAVLHEGLSAIPRVRVIGAPPGAQRGFVISFILDDAAGNAVDPLVVSQALAERYRISTRAGLHCAPTAHLQAGTYDRGGTVRFSVSFFNTMEQMQYALQAVAEVAAAFA
jgi:cysteine desulfurase / selenocysteine lyase